MTEQTETAALQTVTITPQELELSLKKARHQNTSLLALLKEKKVPEEALAESFAAWLKLPRVRLASITIDTEMTGIISQELATNRVCLPLRVDGKTLILAMANPTDYDAIQDVQFASGLNVHPVVATQMEIMDRIQEVFATGERMQDFMSKVADATDFCVIQQKTEQVNLDNTRSEAELAPVVKMCNLILQEAIKARASDIHLEPGLNSVQVRLRVDGVLREYMDIPKWLQSPVISRLKILAALDIAERRMPQDGRINVQFQSRSLDIRVSTLPTHFGEKVVLRILGTSTLPTFEEMGLSQSQLSILESALSQPQGLVLVTGPTGSGKSTSLYSMLSRRQSPEVNIVTVEDPIEYQLPGINQVQVNVKTGLTFANCLRSILRQDPDVILLGEIRDSETAEVAFQAAMTGHLVLSTLHTNSALAATTRLLDLGTDPFLITSTVNLIIAQRLARRVCSNCKKPTPPAKALLERLKLDAAEINNQRGEGCSACGNTGYSGRVGIFELLIMSPTLRELLRRRASETELARAALKAGTKFLLEDALAKVNQGVTDLEEVVRVIELQREELFRCPKCARYIQQEFSSCPYCLHALRHVCTSCGQDLKPDWNICPYCNTPFRGAAGESLPEATSKLLPAQPEPRLEQGRPQAQLMPPDQASIMPAKKRPKILVVDDDAGIRKIIVKALNQLPLETELLAAADGVQALETIRQHGVDLVLLDIGMPRMDGFAVCRQLREDIRTAFVPVVMLTANTDENTRTQGYLVGTDDYICKPFSVPDLNARVMRLLRRTYGL